MKQASVEEQYQKQPKIQKEEVLKLVEWTKQQPHLPEVSELMACSFLHACAYSLEIAKQTFDLFCTTRTMCPEFFSNRDVAGKDITEIMKTIMVYPLPGVTPKGQKVYIAKLIDVDPSKYIFATCIKFYIMCAELILHEEGLSNGIILVFDLKGAQVGHIGSLNPLVAKKFLFFIQECPPVRLHSTHFVNCVPFLDKLMAILRPFMKKEVQNRIQVHKNIETIYEYIPKDYLPVEYGGNGISVDKSYPDFYKHIKECREFFIEQEQLYRADEKLRPGKPKNESEIFGAEGNFKKLDID